MGIEIEGPFEEQWGTVKAAIKQHDAAINGNGHKGLLDFQSGIKAQLRLIVFLVSLIGLIVAFLAFLETNRQIKQGSLHSDLPSDYAQRGSK